MKYYLAQIHILRLQSFYRLVEADSFEQAREIAEREFTKEDGYRVNIQITLE
tara:strand:+ start:179 stop:334 length:156 start_codon:yes stop_codon:yes gene_type:complete